MARSYEELMGSVGRAVYFRPERRRVRELLSKDSEPVLEVGKSHYRLFDISISGVSFVTTAAEAANFAVGSELDVAVLIHNSPVYSGRVRVARQEQVAGGSLIGVALLNGLLDLFEFHRRDEDNRLERELARGVDTLRRSIPGEYRAFLEKAVSWAQYYRLSLNQHEGRYASRGEQALEDLVRRSFDALLPQWVELEEEGSDLATHLMADAAALKASKRYTELLLTPLLVDSPMFGRSFKKPRGYPGDYQTMLYCYENKPEGRTLFDKVFHKLCVEHPLANGVRTRKDWVVSQIRAEYQRHCETDDKNVFRAASLGCGPGREVNDFASGQETWPARVHWSLMDQEEEALSLAYQNGTRALSAAKGLASLECLHISFAQFLVDPSVFPCTKPQQLIYSVGLFDYVRERMGQAIVLSLYQHLAPGGLLLVGNAMGPNRHFWSLEFPTDWTLLYRTEEQVKKLAAKLPSEAGVEVELEPGNAYYFLKVRKP